VLIEGNVPMFRRVGKKFAIFENFDNIINQGRIKKIAELLCPELKSDSQG
jgi:hypothetical protein